MQKALKRWYAAILLWSPCEEIGRQLAQASVQQGMAILHDSSVRRPPAVNSGPYEGEEGALHEVRIPIDGEELEQRYKMLRRRLGMGLTSQGLMRVTHPLLPVTPAMMMRRGRNRRSCFCLLLLP